MPAHRHLVPPLAERGHLRLTEHELRDWGEQLGRSINPPLLITLTGELGAGKTTLAQAICLGYGVQEAITSPTYALVQEYSAPRSTVFHIDLYRVESPEQLTNLGWDDILAGARGIATAGRSSADRYRLHRRRRVAPDSSRRVRPEGA